MKHTGVYFALNTLEFLHRGGRIGGAAAFMGTMLNLKPLLELRDGRIEAVERVRTFNKTVSRLLDLVEANLKKKKVPFAWLSSMPMTMQKAEELLERAVNVFQIQWSRMRSLHL